jgi:hypothetical protein
MEIIRTIVEVSEQQRLDKAVDEAEAKVGDWRRSIAAIETQLNTANLSLANAKQIRENHALKAAMGDAVAIEAVTAARSEQSSAEQTIADLQIALPEAMAQLAKAEKAAAAARHAVAKAKAEEAMKNRIAKAGEIDAAIADFARLYHEYEALGREIIDMPDALPPSVHGIRNYEGAVGLRRVAAALPPFMQRFFRGALHDERKREPLAVTEARHRGLPAVEEDDKSRTKTQTNRPSLL